jgi:hypothetical protein
MREEAGDLLPHAAKAGREKGRKIGSRSCFAMWLRDHQRMKVEGREQRDIV